MRERIEIFPTKLRNLWNNLELRILVLLSLFLQIILIATGNRRKYTRHRCVAVICWLSYLSADAIATLALGVLSQSQGEAESLLNPRYTIMAFWAPFLLMHLGGPDTITAYALADNELWSRHLLGLIGQVGVALYVFLRSWISTPLNYLNLLIFLPGLVKYGERSYVLYLASRDQFRDSMVSGPDPGPNYAKFMDELVSKENEGYKVDLGRAVEIVPSEMDLNLPVLDDAHTGYKINAAILQAAYYFFNTFKKLFADLILSFQDKEGSLSVFRKLSWDKAFGIIEVELGLIYDLFYTKALLLYSLPGCLLRVLSCSSTVAAFVAFLILDKHIYRKTEVIITYFLLVGAIFLEIYAIMILLSSDMMMIWLSKDWITLPGLRKLKDLMFSFVCKTVPLLRYLHIVPAKMRWSNAMGQHNLLKSCIESKPACPTVHRYLEKYLFWNSIDIPNGLKALIFDELKLRVNSADDKRLGRCRGDTILLKEMEYLDEKIDNIEFDQSVLLWHVATDICYHTGINEEQEPNKTWLYDFIVNDESHFEDKLKFKRGMSRYLSNYMMYLLIASPFMLPSGIGQIRFQDTRAEVLEVLEGQKLSTQGACDRLRKVDTRFSPSEIKGDRSKSLLFDAVKLAKSLESLEIGQKWEKITQAWLDLLTFAAAQCRWNDHAEKLSQGGELLTHVWLLMAHFGMTDNFQISEGYKRAKLVAT